VGRAMTGTRAPTAWGDTVSHPQNLAGAFRPYPEYNDSELPWLGKIPKKWEIKRGKKIFREIDIRSKNGDEELLTVSAKYGVLPRKEKIVPMFKAESYAGYKLCWPGDLVINSLWAWMHGLGFSRYHGIVSTAYGVYRPLENYSSYCSYFDYLLRSNAYDWELRVRSKGIWISRLQLLDAAFFDMPIIIPPEEEAKKIVAFIRFKKHYIRQYIRVKQHLIKLLTEQKQVIINNAVLRGIDNDNVKFKTSSLGWLKEIPQHWDEYSIAHISDVIQIGPFGSQLHASDYTPNGTPVINPCHLLGNTIIPDYNCAVSEKTVNRLLQHKLEQGDIILSRRGELGRCAIVEQSQIGWLCGTGCIRLSLKKEIIDPNYFVLLFSCQQSSEFLTLSSVGATMDNLNSEIVARYRIPCPPGPEQIRILSFIAEEKDRIESIIATARHEIELIQEYHARLIADVVTGKVDVRNVEIVDDAPVVDDLVDAIDELDDNADDDVDGDDRDDENR
jgi:type I restriction enzyme S subunit